MLDINDKFPTFVSNLAMVTRGLVQFGKIITCSAAVTQQNFENAGREYRLECYTDNWIYHIRSSCIVNVRCRMLSVQGSYLADSA